MESQARHRIVFGDLRGALLSLALPMAIGNFAHNLFNLTDMYFVGRLGSVSIAAVGMAGVIMSAMMMLIIGLSMATRAMVARYIGAGDQENAHSAAVGSIMFGLAISAAIAVGGILLGKLVLILLGAKGELLKLANGYLMIMMGGAFSMVMLFAVNAILQGAGDARTAMFVTITAVALNIALDPLFIFGIGPFPRWGVYGAGFATVLARFIGATIGFIVLLRGVNAFRLYPDKFRTNWKMVRRFLHIGIPGSSQVLLNNFMGFIMMRIAAGFGVAITAAYTIGIRLNMFALLPGFALGGGAATVVGQNLGAGKKQRAKEGAIKAVKFYELYIVPVGVIFFAFAHQIISIFTKDPAVIRAGTDYLRYVSLSYPLFAIGAVLMRAINGSGKTVPPTIAVFVALYLIQLPLAIILSSRAGPSGIWLSIAAGMAGQGVLIIPYFFSMKWAKTGKWK